jgi:N4-gp56 family major capsid protein
VASVAIDNFIPEFWAARLQRHLDGALIYAQPQVCNREWEGEIAQAGDTVHIQKIGNPEIKDYDPGIDMDAPEEPDGSTLALTVDQFRYFNVMIDDVNKAQVNVNLLDGFAQRAGVGMAQTMDAFVAGKMVAAATVNHLGTDAVPIIVKADGSGDFTPYELAVEIEAQLEESNAPSGNHWMVVNPSLMKEIRKDDAFIKASEMGAEMVRNGVIGQISGIELLTTTRVPTSAGSGGSPVPNNKILAGAGNYATTFANQVTEMKAYEPERRFGDATKGLEVYGAKVLEPETLSVGHVAK